MSDKPISPLRQRMIDDMTAPRFSEKVQKAYVRHVRSFAAFLGRSPDAATAWERHPRLVTRSPDAFGATGFRARRGLGFSRWTTDMR